MSVISETIMSVFVYEYLVTDILYVVEDKKESQTFCLSQKNKNIHRISFWCRKLKLSQTFRLSQKKSCVAGSRPMARK